jgi:hypothetical protein
VNYGFRRKIAGSASEIVLPDVKQSSLDSKPPKNDLLHHALIRNEKKNIFRIKLNKEKAGDAIG